VVKPHILLVEDEEAVREISTQMLRMLGYEVTSAVDGTQALHVIQQDPTLYDLFMLDLNLPGMSGRQLLQELRKLRPDARAIFCSGDPEPDSTPGDPPHLYKPYRLVELKSCIESQLSPAK
jgi:two-component system cell cycle sensor histidine kinase/response regulator CckA